MPLFASAAYARLFRYLRPYRGTVGLALLASGGAAAAAAFYAYLIGPLLKAVLTGSGIQVGPLSLTRESLWTTLPLMLVSVAVVKSVSQLLQGGWMQSVGQKVLADLRRDLYGHLLSLPPRYFEKRHSGELLSRLTSDVAQVEFAVTQALTSYVKDSLQVLALLGMCLLLDVRLFALSFIVLPAAIIPVSRFAKSVKRIAKGTQASLGQLSLLAAEQLHNLPAVQAYRGEAAAMAQFDLEQDRYLGAMKASLFVRGAFTPVVEVLGMIGAALAIGVGARAVFAEPALAGKLLSFLAAALLMYQPLKALSGTFSLVMQGLGSAGRLFEISDEPAPPETGAVAAPLHASLSFEDVSVSYGGDRWALSNVRLQVPAGKRVALVGASGAGKTTAFFALLRLTQVTSGRILWDGQDLTALCPSSVRAQIAWVPQEPILFSGTVGENLLWGRPEASEAELWEALRLAHAEAFVRALPRGLDEPVGERGARLSGGQRQRLAIARAFLRRPSLLLLDEPTSALDAESEEAVQAGLAELMRGRTTLVIAHRLSTVRDADLLYVLDRGQVVEAGTHSELSERGGRYTALLQGLDAAFQAAPLP